MDIALRYAARSDVGLVRLNNQDSGYAGAHLLVVADGMGGHAGGDVASAITVGALMHLDAPAHEADAVLADLEQAIDDARQDLVDRSVKDPDLAGMGTTVTALMLVDNKLAMAHLGDSRAYVLRGDEFVQATTDHTFVQHLVDTGRISPEEAETHPQRNVVMRVLGDFDIDLTPDLSIREAKVGDRWMLCSDGLSGFVHADELATALLDIEDPAECADSLLQQALDAGSTDNVTVIVADIVEAPTTTGEAERQVVGAAANEDLPDLLDASNPTPQAPAAPASVAPIPLEGTPAPDDVEERPRRRGMTTRITLIAILVLVVGGLWGGYHWTQTQYYLGISDGKVAIFQGIPATVGPLSLSHAVELSDTSADDLEPFVVDRLRSTIPEDSLDAARAHMKTLVVVEDTADPAPSSTPSTTPEPSVDEKSGDEESGGADDSTGKGT